MVRCSQEMSRWPRVGWAAARNKCTHRPQQAPQSYEHRTNREKNQALRLPKLKPPILSEARNKVCESTSTSRRQKQEARGSLRVPTNDKPLCSHALKVLNNLLWHCAFDRRFKKQFFDNHIGARLWIALDTGVPRKDETVAVDL